MTPRLPRALAVLAIAALALSGCAVASDPTWQPAPWPAAAVSIVDAPPPVDAASLGDLNGQRLRNDTVGIQARYAFLPGDAPINDRLRELVWNAVHAASARTGAAYTPQVFGTDAGMRDRMCVTGSTLRAASDLLDDAALGPGGPVGPAGPAPGEGTALVCDVVAAAGDYFGERVRVVGSDGSDVSTVLYTDVSTGEVVTGDGLWTEAAPLALWDDIVDALRRQAGSLSLEPVQAPDAAGRALIADALAHTAPMGDGTLAVTLPAGFAAPELAALGIGVTTVPETFAVAPDAAAPLLSTFGAGLVAAESSDTPFAAPAVVPAGFETVDCALLPCLSLTYDDGPSTYTPTILDAAKAHHVAVTFFAMGQKAVQYRDTLLRELAEGHLVGNHTWNHPHLPSLTPAQIQSEIADTQVALAAADGSTPVLFRPPYGEYDAVVEQKAGMPLVLWNVDSRDWTGKADDQLITDVVTQSRVGSIVLQHDIQPNTMRTVDAVYDGLHDRGFVLVNLKQLFGGTLPTAGVISRGP